MTSLLNHAQGDCNPPSIEVGDIGDEVINKQGCGGLKLKDFFSSLKFKIMVVVAGVLIGLILFGVSTGSFSTPGAFFGTILSPITKVVKTATDSVTGFVDRFLRFGQYQKENEQLKEQVEDLQKQMVDYNDLKTQNEQLRNIAGIKEEHSDFEMIAASVSARDADNLYSFKLNKGSVSGVEKDDPVITSAGLVGKVTAVAPTYCEVQTILSPDLQVSAYVSRTNEAGTVAGKADLALNGQCQMEHLNRDNSVTNGDLIVTTGSSGLFPKGIIVGSALSTQISDNGMSSYLVIQPSVDFANVTDVTIVKSFSGKGDAAS